MLVSTRNFVWTSLVGAGLVLAACGGSDSEAAPPRQLVSVSDVSSGDDCAAGGQMIATGNDKNGNGELDDSEVQQTRVVCDGEDGADATSPTVRLQEEDPGDNCPNGGWAVRVGVDANDDGNLSDDEVSDTRYVCNGTDGQQSLVDIDEEPAGDNCESGGWAIRVGTDTDDDGSLADDEVETTRYVCNGTDGKSVAIRKTELPPGDTCPRGGQRIEFGVDDNQNGELDEDEVDATNVECDKACPPGAVWNKLEESCVNATKLVAEGSVDNVDLDDGRFEESVSEGDACKFYAIYDESTEPDDVGDANKVATYKFASPPAAVWMEVGGSLKLDSGTDGKVEAAVADDYTNLMHDFLEITSTRTTSAHKGTVVNLKLQDDSGDVWSSLDIPSPVPSLSSFDSFDSSYLLIRRVASEGTDNIQCTVDSLTEKP